MNRTCVTIPRLHVGAGTTVGSLTVFPVWVEGPSVHGLHWSGSRLTIGELDDGPSVGQLQVTNGSSRPAVLLEGDVVEGGWQNRMLAASSLLASRRDGCGVRTLRGAGPLGRRAVAHRANGRRAAYSVAAARRSADGLADQGDVWQRVGRFEQLYGRHAERFADRSPATATRAADPCGGRPARRDHRYRRPGRGRGDLRPYARPAQPLGRDHRRGLAGRAARAGHHDSRRTGPRARTAHRSGVAPIDARRGSAAAGWLPSGAR